MGAHWPPLAHELRLHHDALLAWSGHAARLASLTQGGIKLAQRRSSFSSAVAQMQRDAARGRAAQVRAQREGVQAANRALVARNRAAAADEKERKRLYLESRLAEVAEINEDLEAAMAALDGLLAVTLTVDDYLDFESMKEPARMPQWGDAALEIPTPTPDPDVFAPAPLTGLSKVFGGKARYARDYEAARVAYETTVVQWHQTEATRVEELAHRREAYDAAVQAAQAKANAQHTEVDDFRSAFDTGDPEAVTTYFELVLTASTYPEMFVQAFKLAYVPESRQVVVEYELPPLGAVPAVKLYKYVHTSDSVTETARPATQVRAQYTSVVAQVALRTVHELFEADRGRHLDVVIFNGVLDTVDPGSGKSVRPCLVTLRTTKDAFLELDLARVDPLACLKHLSASVSKSPAELIAVRPVLEFSMVDPRYVAESDALSLLDHRPNLMELSPSEFEALIQNLFTKMGLDSRQTRPSRDGGVDCVAFDPRPIFGGKVVIQAKRYKNTVGVSAVRDLFGLSRTRVPARGYS